MFIDTEKIFDGETLQMGGTHPKWKDKFMAACLLVWQDCILKI